MTGLGSVSDMAFSGYARCTKESLAVHSLDHKYARQCALRTKEYGQEVYACNRRRRCGSSPWSSRRTLETCHTLSSVWGQGAAFLRPAARHSEHHAEDARPTTSSNGDCRHWCAQA